MISEIDGTSPCFCWLILMNSCWMILSSGVFEGFPDGVAYVYLIVVCLGELVGYMVVLVRE